MFRIKKEDYNTVQFLPEYGSSTKPKGNAVKPVKVKRSKKSVLIVILVILLIIAACAAFVYFRFLTPSRQFLSAFASEDYSACTTLSSENSSDSGFISAIGPTVQSACDSVLSDFNDGKVTAENANSTLDNYNAITSGGFADYISGIKAKIQASTDVTSLISAAKDSCTAQKYDDALSTLIDASQKASDNSLNVDADIKDIISGNLANFKYVLFKQAATDIRNKQYDTIMSQLSFVNSFAEDQDISDMISEIQQVQDGTVTSAEARTYAADATKTALAAISGTTTDTTASSDSATTKKSSTSKKSSSKKSSAKSSSSTQKTTTATDNTAQAAGNDAAAADTAPAAGNAGAAATN